MINSFTKKCYSILKQIHGKSYADECLKTAPTGGYISGSEKLIEYKYGDKVSIKCGFYEGYIGKVVEELRVIYGPTHYIIYISKIDKNIIENPNNLILII